MKQKNNPEIAREAEAIPDYNEQEEVIGIYIVVVDVSINNSIENIEHHLLYLWLLEDNEPLLLI